jgi:hypothetical protein
MIICFTIRIVQAAIAPREDYNLAINATIQGGMDHERSTG